MAVGLPCVLFEIERLGSRTPFLFLGRGSSLGLVHPEHRANDVGEEG